MDREINVLALVKGEERFVFRYQTGFAVFVVDHDRARRRAVQIGHHGEFDVEVIGGLEANERVIVHPPNELNDGALVRIAQQ